MKISAAYYVLYTMRRVVNTDGVDSDREVLINDIKRISSILR